jgi:hypothetical protein
MAVVIHFRDGTTLNEANGIDAGPYVQGNTVSYQILQIVNSSQRVGIAPTEIVKYIEISPA